MNKKGFSLIELIAVIMILGIIALIAIPKVSDIISDAKKDASKQSVMEYFRAVETKIKLSQLEGNSIIEDGTYNIGDIEVVVKGDTPKSGIFVVNKGKIIEYDVIIDNYNIVYSGNSFNIKDKNSSFHGTYVAASQTDTHKGIVYLDPTNLGNYCNSSNSVSTIGTNSGCMKFYIYRENENDTIDLLVDHNIAIQVQWHTTDTNATGPSEILDVLKQSTKDWTGIPLRRDKYSYSNDTAEYEIDYSGYRARLISADEIAEIVGATFDELTSTDGFYFETGTKNKPTTYIGNYGWLYNYTFDCTNYGCQDQTDGSTTNRGYWTSSAKANDNRYAWYVHYEGKIGVGHSVNIGHYGLRPVITLPKSLIID